MNWFEKLCHNVGLTLHNVKHPDGATPGPAPANTTETRELSRTVEEEHRGHITLRRTTIEEIEIKKRETSDE